MRALAAVALLVCATAHAAPSAQVQLTPFAAPGYTPELGLILTAGGVLTWNGDPARPWIPRSSLTLVAGGTTVGAFLAQGRLTAFFGADRVRVTAPLEVRDMPDHYFGVGFSNGFTRPLGPNTTYYRRTWAQVTPTVMVRLGSAVYVGPVVDVVAHGARDQSAGVLADPDYRKHLGPIVNAGFGLTAVLDTRDVPVNAWGGALFQATWVSYAHRRFPEPSWHALTLDYRHYVPLFRRGSTLAWQLRHRAVFGDVPWTDLSQAGAPFHLRAYRWGQYRDRSATTAVLEYRFMLPFAEESLFSRLGLAAWVGAGALGPDGWPDLTRLLPAAGVGLRVELQRRVTVRLDVGFGRASNGVYLNFLEAF